MNPRPDIAKEILIKPFFSIDLATETVCSVIFLCTFAEQAFPKSLEKKGLIDISLAISGLGFKKSKSWSKELGVKNFSLQGRGCLGEKMKRQILINKNFCLTKTRNIIFIGTDLPDLCHMDLLNTLTKLKKNDLIIGPSNDGGYWLIAFSERSLSTNLVLPFINIKWGTQDVLKQTINNFSSMHLKHDFLHRKIDIDTIIDIEKRV